MRYSAMPLLPPEIKQTGRMLIRGIAGSQLPFPPNRVIVNIMKLLQQELFRAAGFDIEASFPDLMSLATASIFCLYCRTKPM
jgi:hypothetical protein